MNVPLRLFLTLAVGTMLSCEVLCCSSAEASESRVHALLVIDTDADTPALGLAIAGNRMLQLFNSLPSDERSRLSITILQGRDANATRIRQYYSALRSDPLDTLFFYYMGHGTVLKNRGNGYWGWGEEYGVADGFRMPRGGTILQPESTDPRFQALAFTNADAKRDRLLPRNELQQLLVSRPSRASIIFCDCCASFTDGQQGITDGPAKDVSGNLRIFASKMRDREVSDVASPGRINVDLWRRMMWDSMGMLDIAGAPVGYYGFGNEKVGGLSSFVFTETLCASNDRFEACLKPYGDDPTLLTTWNQFIRVISKEYQRYFFQARSERGINRDGARTEFGPTEFQSRNQRPWNLDRLNQIPRGSAIFALEHAGIYCRIQPGSQAPPGFYVLASADGVGIHRDNAATIYQSILDRRTRAIQIQNAPDPRWTGKLFGDTYEVQIAR